MSRQNTGFCYFLMNCDIVFVFTYIAFEFYGICSCSCGDWVNLRLQNVRRSQIKYGLMYPPAPNTSISTFYMKEIHNILSTYSNTFKNRHVILPANNVIIFHRNNIVKIPGIKYLSVIICSICGTCLYTTISFQ